MAVVRLRPIRSADLEVLSAEDPVDNPFEFFGFRAANQLERRFAADGLISDDRGTLGIEADGELVGVVGWSPVHHGPSTVSRALNVGISLLAAHRGRGYGTVAQAMFAAHLFDTMLVERLEATTDVENFAEQRALTKAGFQREGVLRHTQFRAGRWHDTVIFSRLRGD